MNTALLANYSLKPGSLTQKLASVTSTKHLLKSDTGMPYIFTQEFITLTKIKIFCSKDGSLSQFVLCIYIYIY